MKIVNTTKNQQSINGTVANQELNDKKNNWNKISYIAGPVLLILSALNFYRAFKNNPAASQLNFSYQVMKNQINLCANQLEKPLDVNEPIRRLHIVGALSMGAHQENLM